MRQHRPVRRLTRNLAASAAVLVAATAPVAASPAGAAGATFSFAFIGDVPYTSTQVPLMPQLTADVNADADVQFVAHSGDFKGGSDSCSDSAFTTTFNHFAGFTTPFWYTPGDNDWTDCHRANNGGFHPLEREGKVRSMYFDQPDRTTQFGTAHSFLAVQSQARTANGSIATTFDDAQYPENNFFTKECVTFGSIHSVTSNNGIPNKLIYNGSGNTTDLANYTYSSTPAITIATPTSGYTEATSFPTETTDRKNEALARIAADLRWIDRIFDEAIANNSEGVFLMMQAEPLVQTTPDNDKTFGDEFRAIRDKLFARADAFGKPVVLAHGDQHVYTWTPNYQGHPNITRLENFGSNTGGILAVQRWVKVTASCGTPEVFSQVARTVGVAPVVAVPEGRLAVGLLVTMAALALAGGFVIVRRRPATL